MCEKILVGQKYLVAIHIILVLEIAKEMGTIFGSPFLTIGLSTEIPKERDASPRQKYLYLKSL
jgi:hypothetical protein